MVNLVSFPFVIIYRLEVQCREYTSTFSSSWSLILVDFWNYILTPVSHYCVVAGEGGPPDTTFIEDAVHELLKTRRILKCSYPYGFFLEPKSTKKEIFELMQVNNTDASLGIFLTCDFWVSDYTALLFFLLDWLGNGDWRSCTESQPALPPHASA